MTQRAGDISILVPSDDAKKIAVAWFRRHGLVAGRSSKTGLIGDASPPFAVG
jgi:hypothetical protein